MGTTKCIANKNLFLLLTVFLGTVHPLLSQSQISFRQLSVEEGLSQNSAISITQDSTGYLWIATQDGLNKYDGKKFSVFPYSFVDITKPDYSNLGKVYVDRRGRVWIIPSDRIPRKLNAENQKSKTKIATTSVLLSTTILLNTTLLMAEPMVAFVRGVYP